MILKVEASRDEIDQIQQSLKEQFPDLEVRLLLKKSLTNFEEVQIIMGGIQLLVSVIALIYQIVPPASPSKIKIKVTDEKSGRTLSIEGGQANVEKIVEEFFAPQVKN